jgi:hypothetical protein
LVFSSNKLSALVFSSRTCIAQGASSKKAREWENSTDSERPTKGRKSRPHSPPPLALLPRPRSNRACSWKYARGHVQPRCPASPQTVTPIQKQGFLHVTLCAPWQQTLLAPSRTPAGRSGLQDSSGCSGQGAHCRWRGLAPGLIRALARSCREKYWHAFVAPSSESGSLSLSRGPDGWAAAIATAAEAQGRQQHGMQAGAAPAGRLAGCEQEVGVGLSRHIVQGAVAQHVAICLLQQQRCQGKQQLAVTAAADSSSREARDTIPGIWLAGCTAPGSCYGAQRAHVQTSF